MGCVFVCNKIKPNMVISSASINLDKLIKESNSKINTYLVIENSERSSLVVDFASRINNEEKKIKLNYKNYLGE